MNNKRKRSTDSILVDETSTMRRKWRKTIQAFESRLGHVHEREHPEESQQSASSPEEAQQNGMLQHPLVGESQRFDGIDPNLNPEPPLNTEARREYDNKRREQEKEKQYRLALQNSLDNTPTYSSTPRPRGP